VPGAQTLERIGKEHGKSSVQVALRWLIQQDKVAAIPRSSKAEHIEADFDIYDFELSSEDVRDINALPKDKRQIDPPFAEDWQT
jgi:2,5-diketo-D-gluconate reductase B